MNIHKLDAHKIATQCSPVHIENVILDLVELLKLAERLTKEVDTLNVHSNEIGSGKMANMKALCEQFVVALDN